MRPEDELQASVCAYLRRALTGSSWFCAVPNGSVLAGNPKQRGMQMARLKKTGLIVGSPDLIICSEGRFIGLELKAGKGKPTESQLSACDAILAAGGLYTIVRSIDEVEAYLRLQGVPLKATIQPAT